MEICRLAKEGRFAEAAPIQKHTNHLLLPEKRI